jgi:hypothetical protein
LGREKAMLFLPRTVERNGQFYAHHYAGPSVAIMIMLYCMTTQGLYIPFPCVPVTTRTSCCAPPIVPGLRFQKTCHWPQPNRIIQYMVQAPVLPKFDFGEVSKLLCAHCATALWLAALCRDPSSTVVQWPFVYMGQWMYRQCP